MQFVKYFQETIVYHFHCIIFGAAITPANSHSKPVEPFIKFLLAFPFTFYAATNDFYNIMPVWQNQVGYYVIGIFEKKVQMVALL